MRQRTCLVVATMLAVVLEGCSAVDVYSQDGTDAVKERGIPFYVKVPVLNHETQRIYKDLEVVVELSSKQNDQAPRSFPLSGPLRVEDTPANRQSIEVAINKITAYLDEQPFFEQAANEVRTALAGIPSVGANRSAPDVLTNTWSIQMVTGPRMYYITNRVPAIGSATASFEFASDGTLTKASSTVEDDTIKTLLSLFPFTSELEKKWAISQTKGVEKKESEYSASIKVTSVDTVFTLRSQQELPKGSNINAYAAPTGPNSIPLSLSDALSGNTGVQLVSRVEIKGDDDTKKKSSDASKAYQLSGTITPPAAASSADAGGSPVGLPQK
jgi:hypothetical protein